MRYEPLTRHLESRQAGDVRMTFREIERVLNRGLPMSARRHQAWWANTTSHSHADSWLRIGWRTHDLDLAGERVAFARGERGRARQGAPDEPRAGESREDTIQLRRHALTGAARRLLEAHAAARGCSQAEAVAELLARAAAETKRQSLERFPLDGERSAVDSADLIREDRDAR